MVADPTVDLPSRRFTVDEYELMGRVGVFADDERTELLNGAISVMSPIGPRHADIVDTIMESLVLATRRTVRVRVQNPVRLPPRSEPQPDIVVAKRRSGLYSSAHPTAEDTLLVVEVAESSLALDTAVKLPIYAEQGIVEVWIVDVKAMVVRVYTDPVGKGYQSVQTLTVDDELVPVAIKGVRIPVSEIF
jgi:Uma2 family endonuclease